MIDDLIASASLGTARATPPHPSADGDLGAALASIASDPPEPRLLATVAILTRYESAGRLPTPSASPPTPAPPDDCPPCSRRAADALAYILSLTNTPAKEHLLLEWLDHAIRANQRPPHRLLPPLFDYGTAYRAPRSRIGALAGPRGQWLMSQNPRWQFPTTPAPDADPASTWTTGNRDQRLATLKSTREHNPAAARDLIQSTWAEDAGEDRAVFVAALRTNLSPDDEPFLESALDDRSKQVRNAAADLLARLPDSAFVARMISRVTPLLTFDPGAKGGILKRGRAPTIDVTLPPDAFDPTWTRDAVVEKPDGRTGRRQWWLQQLLSYVPPTHFSKTWNLSPADTIAATNANEFGDVVRTAWRQSAQRHPDPDWLTALISASLKSDKDAPANELLAFLPPDRRDQVTAEVLASPKLDSDNALATLNATDFPIGPKSSDALIDRIDQRIRAHKGQYDYHLTNLLPILALRLPPTLHDRLADRWTGPAWDQNRKAATEFFKILSLRRDIEKELTP